MTSDFDVDAYLARIGYEGPRSPSLATLQGLHAAHPAAIPFENLGPLLGQPVQLDLSALQEKMVGRRRGGYCFEQNSLFEAALRALGFKVTKYLARVRWMAPPERPENPLTHLLLRVDLDDGPYLADVGFGAHIIAAPLRLVAEIEQKTPAGLLRLMPLGPSFILQTKLPAGWHDLYRFNLEAQQEADLELGNWFTSAHPTSLFRHNLLAERLTPEHRHTLFNTHLTSRDHEGGVAHRDLANATELAEVLDELFHITPPVSPTEIWERLPKE
jgi:N-hydroxyarylamine O-acetyltransferase